jgi:hypothetical protein
VPGVPVQGACAIASILSAKWEHNVYSTSEVRCDVFLRDFDPLEFQGLPEHGLIRGSRPTMCRRILLVMSRQN